MSDQSYRRNYDPSGRRGALIVMGAVVAVIAAGAVGLYILFGGGSADQSDASSQRAAGFREGPPSNSAASSGESTGAAEETLEQTNLSNDNSSSTDDGEAGKEEDAGTAAGDGADGSGEEETIQPASSDEGGSDEGGSHEDSPKKVEEFGEQDEDQVELTVSRFVSAAYGYSGNDAYAYSRAIDALVMPDFYSSTGGEWITRYTEAVAEGGIYSSARLDRFEIAGTSSDEAEGTAYFESGAIGEELTDYYQRITLVPSEGLYKIQAASKEKRVE